MATQHSLSFELYKRRAVVHGAVTRLGTPGTAFTIVIDGESYSESARHTTHRQALRAIIDHLHRNGHIATLRDINLVVHRFSHGGLEFTRPLVLTHADLAQLHKISHYAADVPASTAAVHAAFQQLPSAKHVALFDTSFAAHLPPESYLYAVAPSLKDRFGLRRYGFQGIMHEGACTAAAALVKRAPKSIVSVVIDDAVSVVGVRDGVVYETTTGFTQADGLPGLHRTGSLDPRIPLYLAAHLHMTSFQADALLSNKSGLAAFAGVNSYKELYAAAKKKRPLAIEALMVLSYRIAQAIAGMTASIGKIDMLVFSGSGAHWIVEEEVCRRLAQFGIALGTKREDIISVPRSKIVVVHLDLAESEMMLRQARYTHVT